MDREIRVLFKPSGREVYVLPGTLLLEAAERAGIVIDNPCDGQGTCGKCKVRILSGRTDAGTQPGLSAEEAVAGYRLACQTEVWDELVVEVPANAVRAANEKVLTERRAFDSLILEPGVEQRFFRLVPPRRGSSESDADRLSVALDGCDIPYALLKSVPAQLRTAAWSGTATLCGNELIDLRAGDSSHDLYGVAFDIGTTTIVGTIFDLNNGGELGVSAALNPQVKYGADVISRIGRVRADTDILHDLQQLALGAANDILRDLAGQVAAQTAAIHRIVIAGNSTMQQLLMGIDPSPLGELPFVQAFSRHQTARAEELGLESNPYARVTIMPQIGGFVGGDTVAAMVAAGIDKYSKPVLLIDIGTNGEIVLFAQGRILAASAAAGPALEGARIEQGMRAATGAMEKVLCRDGELHINVIGNTSPIGICGTALIDTIAELLNLGILTSAGALRAGPDLPDDIPRALRDRVVESAGGRLFVLATEGKSGIDRPIKISQKDISETQLAVGAIRAAIAILFQEAGLHSGELGDVLLAGAFGNYIRKENARRIGLIPDLDLKHVHFIGNAALHGASRCLLNQGEMERCERFAAATSHIDLSLNAEFQDQFAQAMLFPNNPSLGL